MDMIRREAVIQKPFPHFCFDDILDTGFANEIHQSFPSYHDALAMGRQFAAVNEKKKIQITDPEKFSAPILELHNILASPEFIRRVEEMVGIPNLIADPDLNGGGIHETDSGGHLDVHVDFNYIPERRWHRRVNILFYFNKNWKEEYGGYLDLWDHDVKNRVAYLAPQFNRAAGFVTGTHSWHGVTPVTCPPGNMRRSFAVYYYTLEPPQGWDGVEHSTIFRARPTEWMKGHVAMPVESALNTVKGGVRHFKDGVKSLIGRG